MENTALNTDPPIVRCGMCGGRCRWAGPWWGGRRRWEGPRWIHCRPGCVWSSHDPRRVGWIWRLRVLIGR
jgi:hypothetical protein